MGKLTIIEKQPGVFPALARLEGVDLVNILLQDQADLVQTFDQRMFAVRRDLEHKFNAVSQPDSLGRQINGECAPGLGFRQNPRVGLSLQDNRQDTIAKAVGLKNLAKTGSDHAADAEVRQRPYGILAR